MTEEEWLAATDPGLMLEFVQGKAGRSDSMARSLAQKRGWLTPSDLKPWKAVRVKVSDRKLRLFACACCRRVWHLLADERSRTAVEVVERFSDGLASEEEFVRARREAEVTGGPSSEPGEDAPAATACRWNAANAVWHSTALDQRGEPWAWASNADNSSWTSTRQHSTQWSASEAIVALLNASCADEGMGPQLSVVKRKESEAQAGLLRDIFGNTFRQGALNPAWLTPTVLALANGIYSNRAFDRMPILADALQDAGCDDAAILDHCRNPNGVHVRGCWVVDLLLARS
jgi:hypothetical protein